MAANAATPGHAGVVALLTLVLAVSIVPPASASLKFCCIRTKTNIHEADCKTALSPNNDASEPALQTFCTNSYGNNYNDAVATNNLNARVDGYCAKQAKNSDTYICVEDKHKAGVEGDPIIQAFDGSRFTFKGLPGTTYALLSAPQHQVNGYIDDDIDPDATYTWITAIGIVIGNQVNLTLTIAKDEAFVSGKDDQRLIAFFNGQDISQHLFSGKRYLYNDVNITLPLVLNDGVKRQARNVLRVHTAEFELGVVLKAPYEFRSASTPCLNVDMKVRKPLNAAVVHGIVGETLSWKGTCKKNCRQMLPGDDSAYEVSGLLAHDLNNSNFDGAWDVFDTVPLLAQNFTSINAEAQRRKLFGHQGFKAAIGLELVGRTAGVTNEELP